MSSMLMMQHVKIVDVISHPRADRKPGNDSSIHAKRSILRVRGRRVPCTESQSRVIHAMIHAARIDRADARAARGEGLPPGPRYG